MSTYDLCRAEHTAIYSCSTFCVLFGLLWLDIYLVAMVEDLQSLESGDMMVCVSRRPLLYGCGGRLTLGRGGSARTGQRRPYAAAHPPCPAVLGCRPTFFFLSTTHGIDVEGPTVTGSCKGLDRGLLGHRRNWDRLGRTVVDGSQAGAALQKGRRSWAQTQERVQAPAPWWYGLLMVGPAVAGADALHCVAARGAKGAYRCGWRRQVNTGG